MQHRALKNHHLLYTQFAANTSLADCALTIPVVGAKVTQREIKNCHLASYCSTSVGFLVMLIFI